MAEVDIYCDDNHSRIVVARFTTVRGVNDSGEVGDAWTLFASSVVGHRAGGSVEYFAYDVLLSNPLGQLSMFARKDTNQPTTARDRDRFVLNCHECKRKAKFRREKISPALDKLRAAGVAEVRLSALERYTAQ